MQIGNQRAFHVIQTDKTEYEIAVQRSDPIFLRLYGKTVKYVRLSPSIIFKVSQVQHLKSNLRITFENLGCKAATYSVRYFQLGEDKLYRALRGEKSPRLNRYLHSVL